MNLKQINEYLVENGYIISIRDKPILTNKYFRDILKSNSVSINLPVVQDIKIVKAEQKAVTLAAGKQLLKQFAEDSCIPHRVPDGRGGEYTVKTYSQEATKAFVSIMNRVANGELDYTILTASTRLYYAKGSYKKTLTNYLLEDIWEAEYLEFNKKNNEGKIEQHIKKGLGGGSVSNIKSI
jgi:hypothetical protein